MDTPFATRTQSAAVVSILVYYARSQIYRSLRAIYRNSCEVSNPYEWNTQKTSEYLADDLMFFMDAVEILVIFVVHLKFETTKLHNTHAVYTVYHTSYRFDNITRYIKQF